MVRERVKPLHMSRTTYTPPGNAWRSNFSDWGPVENPWTGSEETHLPRPSKIESRACPPRGSVYTMFVLDEKGSGYCPSKAGRISRGTPTPCGTVSRTNE